MSGADSFDVIYLGRLGFKRIGRTVAPFVSQLLAADHSFRRTGTHTVTHAFVVAGHKRRIVP